MSIDINNKQFKTLSNTNNGEVSEYTIFHYRQDGEIIWASYTGGDIIRGHLVGKVIDNDHLEFVYHHINKSLEIMTGKCVSYPLKSENGKLMFKEYWQWTCKDNSKGESTIIEV